MFLHLEAVKIEQENPTLNQDILEQGMQMGEQSQMPQENMPQQGAMEQERMTPSNEANLINQL
jgi:hypothetical protein